MLARATVHTRHVEEERMEADEDWERDLQSAVFATTMGDHDEALAILDELIAEAEGDEQRAQAHGTRGGVRIRVGDLHGAQRDLEDALRIDDGNGVAWGNLAIALDRLGAHRDAVAAHDRGIELLRRELGDDHPRVFCKLGDRAASKAWLGDLDAAEEDFCASVAGFERTGSEPLWHAIALHKLGNFLLTARRDPEAALGCYDAADALRDRASLVLGGKVLREGFPAEHDAVFKKNRAAAVQRLGRDDEAAALRAEAERLARATRDG